MPKKAFISYNPFFIIPFLVWVIVGGVLLSLYDKTQLFYAINLHYSGAADELMYYVTWLGEGSVIVVALLLMLLIPRFRNGWYFVLAICCNVIPLLIQQLLKSYFNFPRPRLFFHDSPSMHYLARWPSLIHNSFPSGHSEGAFSFFCFVSLLLPPRYYKLGFVFFALAFAVCYSRVYLTAHFFADVYTGSIIGAVTTTIIYSVMDKYKDRIFNKKDIFS